MHRRARQIVLNLPSGDLERCSANVGIPLKLDVRNLHAFYGESHVLHSVSLSVGAGKLVALIGRNGAGKSTTLKAIMGILRRRHGSVLLAGQEIIDLRPYQIARLGLAYCPEERGIFATLSVEENLLLPPVLAPGGMSITEIYDLFPRLRSRRQSGGTTLSGGEQQMLAIARLLRSGANTFLLDEPTEGLAPVIVDQLRDIIGAIKARGATIVLVEQNLDFVAALADEVYVLESGHVVKHVGAKELASGFAVLESYLTV
jgi:branched-chain amino acid transport system ATP-binding protein